MHIYTTCTCGTSLRVGNTLAGRKIRCPQCHKLCPIPSGMKETRLEDQASAILLSGPAQLTKPNGQKPKADLRRTPPPPTRKKLPDLGVESLPTTQGSHFVPPPHLDLPEEEEGIGSIQPRTLGGILVAAIAICWLGSGYAPGLFLVFPVILLGFGFMTAVKGIFPGD